ncbi:MAG: hypothetical protein FWF59_06995 [Turicibacter sp.]|nr:hypothetical protein [Turicibacter sp.]
MAVFVVLTRTSSVFSKLIGTYTRQPYDHASISFDAWLTEVYSFGRKKTGNPFVGGFVHECFAEGYRM